MEKTENPAAGHSGGARKLVYSINANTPKTSLSRCDNQVFRASPKNCASSNSHNRLQQNCSVQSPVSAED